MGELRTDPFPHVVIDDYCWMAETLLKEYPDPTPQWYCYDNIFETKWAIDNTVFMPNSCIQLLSRLNDAVFLKWLEPIFNIDGLIPDPYLRGGGLHYIKTGGKLDIHADFNIHPKLKLQRRLNVILYLNKDWKPEYGGELQLWNRDLTQSTIIEPSFNRLVAFETGSYSFHGHPTPWAAPYPRRSIATYYYTVPIPGTTPHSTLYQKLPGTITTPEIEEFRVKRGKGRI